MNTDVKTLNKILAATNGRAGWAGARWQAAGVWRTDAERQAHQWQSDEWVSKSVRWWMSGWQAWVWWQTETTWERQPAKTAADLKTYYDKQGEVTWLVAVSDLLWQLLIARPHFHQKHSDCKRRAHGCREGFASCAYTCQLSPSPSLWIFTFKTAIMTTGPSVFP